MLTSTRTRRLGAIAALASAGVAFAVIGAGGGASAQTPETTRTIAFTEVENAEPCCIADIAPKSRSKREPFMSPGDQLVFTQKLRGASDKQIGRLYAKCASTAGAPLTRARYLCEGVYSLADGTMTIAALVRFSETGTSGAITGGTGAYANARGTFSSKTSKPGGDTSTVVTLVG